MCYCRYGWESFLVLLGGWTNPLITDWFADYARVVFTLFGDRVKTWITLNEPVIMCDLAYNSGFIAPGIKDGFGSYHCGKHVMVAHAKAWRIYDEEFRAKYKGKVGITNQQMWYDPKSPEDEELTQLARDFGSGLYSDPIFSKKGGWPPGLESLIAKNSREEGLMRSRLPAFTKEEIDLVKGTFDFLGMNFYTSRLIRKAKEGEDVGMWPLTGIPELKASFDVSPDWDVGAPVWFTTYAPGIREQLGWLKENYGDIEILITENGYPFQEYNLNDVKRVNYIKDHLEQVLLAIDDGVNVSGYAYWSLMDNFEWGDGYKTKFGLYEVRFEHPDRPRIPRDSAVYYASIIRNHSLDIGPETRVRSDEL